MIVEGKVGQLKYNKSMSYATFPFMPPNTNEVLVDYYKIKYNDWVLVNVINFLIDKPLNNKDQRNKE